MTHAKRRRVRERLAPEDRAEIAEQQASLSADSLQAVLAGGPFDLLDPDDSRTVDERICDAVDAGVLRWSDWLTADDFGEIAAWCAVEAEADRASDRALAAAVAGKMREGEPFGY